ncbi:hypothetical protein, partial [Methylophilus sp. OH31]|uniref:hypothetical protein n=1 Tax=Methylophilus sp. OH31 TaxID=1387312 RepID=UPI001A7E2A97
SSYAKVGHPQAPILKRPQHSRVEAFFIASKYLKATPCIGAAAVDTKQRCSACKNLLILEINTLHFAGRKKPGASTGLKSI